MAYADGTFTTPKQIGRRQESFPFDYLTDGYARIIKRIYRQIGTSYTAPGTFTRTAYTNVALYSNDPSNAAWVKTAVTLTTGQPGIQSATSATLAAPSSGDSSMYQAFTPAATVPYTFSFWAWTSSGTVGVSSFLFRVSPLTGVGGVGMTITTTPTLFTLTLTPLDTSSHFFIIGGSSTWSTGEDFYVDGLQIERASTAGPRILTTSVARTVSSPRTDYIDGNTNPDPTAILCTETPPADSALVLGMCEFVRQYARIPATQVEYTSRFVNRPVMDDVFSGSAYAVSFDEGVTSSVFTARSALAAIGTIADITGTVTGTVSTAATDPYVLAGFNPDVWGSSFVSIKGTGVSGFFTSSNAAAIQAGCQSGTGLTVSVVKTNTAIQIIIKTGTLDYIECSDSQVSIEGGATSSITITRVQTSARTEGTTSVSQTATNSITNTNPPPTSIRSFTTSASHGGSAGQQIVFWKGNRVVARSIAFTASGSALTCNATDVPGKDFAADYVGFAPLAGHRYVNGVKNCSIKRSTYFYLPGFTLGITTGADIPSYGVYTDPVSWLAVIQAAYTYAAVQVSDVDYWLGPILRQVVDEVQMADALKEITP